ECVVQLGRDAAELLWMDVPLDTAADMLGYSSQSGLHKLARKYGGYGQRPGGVHAEQPAPVVTEREQRQPVGPLRRVRSRWAAWLADSDPE
ncbi:MAG: hypothetical protein ACRDRL_00330, partial [Sciscionella sp.]